MADVVTKTLTEFEGDSTGYQKAVKDATKATEQLADAQKEQGGTQAKVAKNSIEFTSGFKNMSAEITKMIPGLGGVSRGMKSAEKAAKAFGLGTRAALIATGLGAFIVLIGTLVNKFSNLREKSAEELGVVEKTFLKTFSFIGDSIDWVKEKFLDFMGIFAPAIVEQIRAEETLAKTTEEKNKVQTESIRLATEALNLSRARMDSMPEQFALEQKLIDLMTVGYEKELAQLTLKQKIAEFGRAQAEAAKKKVEEENAARLLASQAVVAAEQEAITKTIEAEIAITKQQNELQTTMQRVTKGWDDQAESIQENIDLTEQQDEAVLKLGASVVANSTASVAGSKELKASTEALVNAGLDGVKELSNNRVVDAVAEAAMAQVRVWASSSPWYLKLPQAALVAIKTAKQVAAIRAADAQLKHEDGGQLPQGGGMITGRRHWQGGVKFRLGGVTNEAEGGEFIVNRKATARFLPLLHQINKKFADGGIVAARTETELSRLGGVIQQSAADARTVLVVEDYRRVSNRLDVVENMARL